METQKIWAFEEIRLFHCGCEVHSWVDSGNMGLNLQPRLRKLELKLASNVVRDENRSDEKRR